MKISSKKSVQILASLLLKNGIVDIVISPGSRNAPLINTFTAIPEFNCLNIVDERSAGFFALGMALERRKPVVLVCTSGSASLNYAPAIVEAYYQKVPLLVVTADRPPEWIDQGDGQTIRQSGIYSNFIKESYNIPAEINSQDDEWLAVRYFNQGIYQSQYAEAGPVHFNMPFVEPIYDLVEEDLPEVRTINLHQNEASLSKESIDSLQSQWDDASRILIITGQMSPDGALQKALIRLAEDQNVAILTETTSNLISVNFNSSIDNILFSFGEGEEEEFSPDLLITLGGQIVSKKVKAFLRKHQPQQHWHFSASGDYRDSFMVLSDVITVDPISVLSQIKIDTNRCSGFKTCWKNRDRLTKKKHDDFLQKTEYSDLKVFEKISAHLPFGCNLHLSNSTPVRYSQLFALNNGMTCFSNRGASGIDGVVSTAAGVAWISKKENVLLVGDLAFFYDSNALWNHYLKKNFKIILINNGGGGIFRFIDGPSRMTALEDHFEAKHKTSAKGLVTSFGLGYLKCTSEEELEDCLKELFTSSDGPSLLEIDTSNVDSGSILKEYMKALKTN
ncbi:2-succinyl-5-enolpyruvyl-6-hydroxy-3-cyclohexene-1-carboxylic-acid synthase [Puteibacter caeruleilacunae]|nr:2-succinyl-5-enolpyruvyl-6-hydroxy-3-cyclohexene-1-carboxylic-acid synthase [Puteibacter caeruleilacunae]